MEKKNGLIHTLLDTRRIYFEYVRRRLDGDTHTHPQQGPMLSLLLCHNGLSQAELARMLHVTPATVAVSAARLENMGLVCREKNAKNQRAYILTLTDEGRREAQRLQGVLVAANSRAVTGFSEDELALIETFCRRIIANLQEDEKKCTD